MPNKERYFRYDGETILSKKGWFEPRKCYKESDLDGTRYDLDVWLKMTRKRIPEEFDGLSGVVSDRYNNPFFITKKEYDLPTHIQVDGKPISIKSKIAGIPKEEVYLATLISEDEYLAHLSSEQSKVSHDSSKFDMYELE